MAAQYVNKSIGKNVTGNLGADINLPSDITLGIELEYQVLVPLT